MRPIRILHTTKPRGTPDPACFEVFCQKTEGGARVHVKKFKKGHELEVFSFHWNLKERRYLGSFDENAFALAHPRAFAEINTSEMHEKIVQLLWAD